MSKIRILPDALASQVAAGEVVERPSAVVRELVENSLDAGATQVEVHVQRGGAALIRVVDNGHGMDREDALLCLERHATSKIRTKEDLGTIRTLGFRGEALPSIASVSRFRLATREPQALSGTEVEIHGGRMQSVRDYGGAPGTVVEARSLFFNVPARRKFLRSEPTESAHVEQQFRLHAIANPQVAFTLIRDGAVVFHLPATTDFLS
ncbi:MAG: DNA mismatch repair endonuclease MutL, partial [Roseimicrobium sp.]